MAQTRLNWGQLDGSAWSSDDWPTKAGVADGWDVQGGRGRILIPGGEAAAGRAGSRFGGVGAMAVTVPVGFESLTAENNNTTGQLWLRVWLLANWDGESTPTDGYCIEGIWSAGLINGAPVVGVSTVRARRCVDGTFTNLVPGPGQTGSGNPAPVLSAPISRDDPPIVLHLSVDAARTVTWGGWKQGEPPRPAFHTVDDSEGGAPEVGAFLIEAFTVASGGAALDVDFRLGTIVYDDLLGVPDEPEPEPKPPLPAIVKPPPSPPPPRVSYDLVAVARIPQRSGPPRFEELDPIPFGNLAYTSELNRPDSLECGVEPSRLSPVVKQRLRALDEWPTELWLYRNGVRVHAGPIIGLQVQGPTLTLQSKGRLYYTRGMILAKTHAWEAEDQHFIAKALIDYWQRHAWGHFGIDTSHVTASGVTRQRTYLGAEAPVVATLLEQLCDVEGGPDIHVDPATGRLQLWTPQRGVDRTGPDGVFIDSRNIASPNVHVSVTPEDLASQCFATTTNDDGHQMIRDHYDEALAARVGRVGYAEAFYDVEDPETLRKHAEALQKARARAMFMPGEELIPVPDCDVDDFDVGDTVHHSFDYGLGPVSAAHRVSQKQVQVSDQGDETVSVGFA